MSNRSVLRNFKYFFPLFSVFFLLLLNSSAPLRAQEASTTGTIHGTLTDEDGNPVAGGRVEYRSKATLTSGVTRSAKDGSYTSEAVPPGEYMVRAEARNMRVAATVVNVQAGAAATADFRLEPINPRPPRAESEVEGAVVDSLPINGRAALDAARFEPGVQVVDGAALDPGKSGYQTLAINSHTGRTTRYDFDEVEAMDETRGTVIQNLPGEAVREVVVTRSTPEVFQSLNAAGAVRVTTRSGEEEWHGNLFGMYRDRRAGLAGFPSSHPNYSRQQYGFGAGGALLKDKAFLFLAGERTKQDGFLPVYQGFPFNFESTRDATFRENMLSGRLDYNLSENAKWFYRYSYDNANEIGPVNSLAAFRNEVNVPAHVFGLDWNRGRFAHSGRFGYQKMVDAINPDFGRGDLIYGEPFHQQLGSFQTGPSILGPRQTIQRDLFGRYDGSTVYREKHTLRFGGAIHRIEQGDFYAPGNFGPSVTSSNGLNVIAAINSNTNAFPPLIPNDPRGPADNPLNYPVGTITIFNGLGNFSEKSVFSRPNGGHFDTRMELHAADTFKLFPNLNITVGVTYLRDTGRVNGDLGAIPCSAINQNIVKPCTGSSLILDQFGNRSGIGNAVNQPNWNFAPQAGVAWDPGRNGRTVVRAGGGMFFDNFLLQNSYQDRMSRLSNGQYFRSLTLCPAATVLFPDGSQVSSVTFNNDDVSIAQLCGQPLGATVTGTQGPVVVAKAIQDLQSQFEAAQAAVTSGPNVYSLANSLANFGGMLAPNFRTPRVVHMNLGFQHELGERTVVSIDYLRQIGTQYPLGIDTNHVGDAGFIDTDAALAAINATLLANPASAGCPAATFAGSSSQTAVACYLAAVPSASIVDFASHGLDSANAYCGPFPCSVLGINKATFSGINPAVGSNIMYFPTGRSQYDGVQLALKTSSGSNPMRAVRRLDLVASYTYSKYRSNVAMADGSGGDFSLLSVAEDFNSPHTGHFGASGLDRRSFLTVAPSFELPHGLRLAMIGQLASPLPLSVRLPQLDGGGVAGEIFRTDLTGDGTVGDLLPRTLIGGSGARTADALDNAIRNFNINRALQLTPAGQQLVTSQLLNPVQLTALGARIPVLQGVPAHSAELTWLKTLDLRLSWPLRVGERFRIEPTATVFNVFNFANFSSPGHQLSGILDASPGSAANYASNGGTCNSNPAICSARLDRVIPGSGTFSLGAPRQFDFGVKITF